MRFFQTLFASAAFVAAAVALEINDFPAKVESGKTYTITYSPADNTPTTFILRQGANANLDTVGELTTTATGGKFQWTVSSSLPNAADYALEIKQGSVSNYIGPVALTGSTATSSVIASSSSKASSTGAPSSTKAVSTTAAPTTSASAAVSSSAGGNSTVTAATLSTASHSTTKPTGASATTGGVPVSTGAASSLDSPLALLLSGFAAMVYFN